MTKTGDQAMRLIERAGLALLQKTDPERAHALALRLLRLGLAGTRTPVTSPRLRTELAGMTLPNPVGTAAGFDKNAQAVPETLAAGFGFAEFGAVTPRPQAGNPRPRLFRLPRDRAVINRFGFNNNGMEAVHAAFTARAPNGVAGINLGANKDSPDRIADYIAVLGRFYPDIAFATINVSSPNTQNLRDLQARDMLDDLLARVLEKRDDLAEKHGVRRPVFLKIAPDLGPQALDDIAGICLARGIDGITATNTTLARTGLCESAAAETGGLSGQPLFAPSTAILAGLYQRLGPKIPLIGTGGIANAEQAYAKIRAGAQAVQLYTAMVYEGIGLGHRIAHGLDRLLIRDGFGNVAQACGCDAGNYR